MTDGLVNVSLFLLGLGLVAAGVGWRDVPTALIVVGCVLMVIVLLSRVRRGAPK
jgi:hypothetical protein